MNSYLKLQERFLLKNVPCLNSLNQRLFGSCLVISFLEIKQLVDESVSWSTGNKTSTVMIVIVNRTLLGCKLLDRQKSHLKKALSTLGSCDVHLSQFSDILST